MQDQQMILTYASNDSGQVFGTAADDKPYQTQAGSADEEIPSAKYVRQSAIQGENHRLSQNDSE